MPKRDNAYYERRLQKDYPETHADWKAGKFKSLTEARYSVGMGKPRTRLQVLINGWNKASLRCPPKTGQ
ncbi:MAG: hypothetical protein HLUCCA12_18005 [Rhodobacteraceae bacterium HLUCCA12]|nr:MAG: hypothetical protein HLUCCA12_18005 [Rhodobacteraceae bacterium HLUCCA12]